MESITDRTPRKKTITDQKKYDECSTISTLLQPFLDRKHSLFRIIKPTLKNTESQKDFDPRKLYNFKEICIEALNNKLPFFTDMLENLESYKKLKEKLTKKNKIPQTKKVSKDIQDSKHLINQINNMIQIFSDAEHEDDLLKLELFNK